jgi:hypothetical protein
LSPSDSLKDFGLRFGACFVILWTPFFFFSSYRGHPISNGALFESALVYAIPALVLSLAMGTAKGVRCVAVFTALVCLFLDLEVGWFDGILAWLGAAVLAGLFWVLREHLSLILFAVFATVLATSVVRVPGDAYVDHRIEIGPEAAALPTATGGRVVHLVLDAFAGPNGIPDDLPGGPELETEIVRFFERNGFRLHPNAISEYAASRASISGILNFVAGAEPEERYHGKHPYVLDENATFEALAARGLAIRVHQSTYMDFCAAATVDLASCYTYRYDGTDWLGDADLDDFDRMSVLLGMVLNRQGFLETFWKAWVGLRRAAGGIGLPLPALMEWDGHVAPIVSFDALDHLRDEILAAPAGTAHFAHLLVPHSPYVYDADCRLANAPLGWLSGHPLHERDNTREGRERRYALYFGQVRCTLRKLDELFEALRANGLWAHTEVVVHGDHGSRIYETAPRERNRDRLGARDLEDAFGTLFAVKSAKSPDLSLDRTMPVSQLLARVVHADGGGDSDAGRVAHGADAPFPPEPPVVHLEGEDEAAWPALAWPIRR